METQAQLQIKKLRTAFDFHNFYGSGDPPKTDLELRLMCLSQEIRAKNEWYKKINTKGIITKWFEELEDSFSCEQFLFVIQELKDYYTKLIDLPIVPAPVDGAYQADQLISSELKQKFLQEVSVLENVPEDELDWHPGSDQQVLDLVHPSLFCLVNGVSRISSANLPWSQFIGSGSPDLHSVKPKQVLEKTIRRKRIKKQQQEEEEDQSWSENFQWLPSEFRVDSNGKVTIESYINNLHPFKHRSLYSSIASIFEKFVPMFNKVIVDLLNPLPYRIEPEIRYMNSDSTDAYGAIVALDEAGTEDADSEDEDEKENRRRWTPPLAEEVWKNIGKNFSTRNQFEERTLILPEVPDYAPPEPPAIQFDLKGRTLQVIVKIADIILTPEKPRYNGGAWHIEGMQNERIVATGIYYFTSTNISQSILQFRRAICEPNYEQNDNKGVEKVFGMRNDDPLNQPAGFIITQEDRCIAFPNLYQHQVANFELEDKTKPGYRKILVFFLVDPTTPVTSTATVPPQQKSWFALELKTRMKGTWFEKLPKEILDHILFYLDWPMDLEDAKKYQEQLMKERKYFVKHTETIFERPFSLCEH